MTNRWRRQRNQRKSIVIAIVVSYVLFLHVLLGGYAQAALLGSGGHSPLFVLCDPHGVMANRGGATDTAGSSELNHLLCKSACALGAALASVPQGFIALADVEALPPYCEPLQQAFGLFMLCYARAPPDVTAFLLS
ncbi:hypothetical protein [Halomonas sp. GFAJ-1]|uniref:hypothetical protein n=1 Tax=Halomonas sp. GFAJ-1 TaxID=1118153 RepID=UPI00023A24D3|nr:hypothetical protein [Halomonas sp. GFAJ-1]AVI62090.1 hypothetical protein BB497_04910 [Halomonas sp. GFAJ-1]EHK61280.1 hypothetical protein MOY_07962 [Halomonas sp. GFAJ-1]